MHLIKSLLRPKIPLLFYVRTEILMCNTEIPKYFLEILWYFSVAHEYFGDRRRRCIEQTTKTSFKTLLSKLLRS
jgi:hypothetical protein